MVNLDYLKNFDAFKEYFKSNGAHLFTKLEKHLESHTCNGLAEIIYFLYKKWPKHKYKDDLIRGIKRGVQARFYKEIYNCDQPHRVIETDKKAINILKLQDKQEIIKEEQAKKEKRLKMPKIAIEDLISEATKLGIEPEKIQKCMQKNSGLAKMSIMNLIKNKKKIKV